jgi:hypothetical protein
MPAVWAEVRSGLSLFFAQALLCFRYLRRNFPEDPKKTEPRVPSRSVLAIFPPTGALGRHLSDSGYFEPRARVKVPAVPDGSPSRLAEMGARLHPAE